ncbi:centromere protein Chl4/mis15/CENP-N [Podospora appendiculata]|uniref:Centromere protein Chl4/mis15/CENP-N n=1 Tax=Podospora appendiculata TaxID=314037 RepID=A0AAE0X399_9PEZI|nr:centromere protein Chl4/mis15/CENP-N [Podospora appendiculata]
MMARLSIPTTARLPSSLRVDPASPAVTKVLNRLSRASLISIALDWLDEKNASLATPYLRRDHDEEDEGEDDDDDGDFYPPARSLAALQELYTQLQARKGSKREVLDRITEGDWRHGLSLYQLAMADLQYLYDHPTSQQWSAYRILPLKPPSRDADGDEDEPATVDSESLVIPRFHPSTFLKTLQAQVLPDVKAHYNFDRHKGLPLLLLRIFITDSPYNTSLGLQNPTATTNNAATAAAAAASSSLTTFDTSRTFYIAFPDASPHIYISKPQTLGPAQGPGESKSLRNLIVEGIPKALSRPRQRFTLKSTSLSTRNLAEMLDRRGAARTNSAGGGWSIYADEKKKESPLDTVLPSPPLSEGGDGDDIGPPRATAQSVKMAVSPATLRDERATKRARLVAQARFGDSARVDDGKGVERVDIVLEDPFPTDSDDEDMLREEGDGDEGDEQQARLRKGGRRSNVEAALEQEEEAVRDEDAQSGAWRPNIRLTFHGSHVFAGIRQLVEHGIIDGERMPGWMTGEEGVTIGAVRHGRIRGHKGSGI